MGKYQYRIFRKIKDMGKKYNQFDVYFYKRGLQSINVKVRFDIEELSSSFWLANQVQIKIITNLSQINDEYTPQKWFKTYSKFKQPLKIYPPSQIINLKTQNPTQNIFKNQLKRINFQIVSALLKNKQLYDNYQNINHDLKTWMSQQSQIEDMFIIQKLRFKNSHVEQGIIKISSLYNMNYKISQIYETISYQAKDRTKIKQFLKNNGFQKQKNISYVKLISNLESNL